MGHRELDDELELVLLLLRRYVARHGHRMVQASGRLDNLFVSMDEARHLLGVQGRLIREPAWQTPGWPDLASLEQEVAARRAAGLAAGADATPPGPWTLLRRRFGLDERQGRLLAAAVAPLLSVDCARLYTFAWADFAQKQPSVAFLAELVGDDEEEVRALVHELRDHRPLVRHGLVLTSDHPHWGAETPLLHRLVRVPALVIAFLTGRLDALPASTVSTHPELLVSSRVRAELAEALVRALADEAGRPRLLLVGPPGA